MFNIWLDRMVDIVGFTALPATPNLWTSDISYVLALPTALTHFQPNFDQL